MTAHLAHLRREAAEAIAACKARYARWATKHADRLAAMHPDVAAEVRSTVADRFHAGGTSGMTDAELHAAKMRVASRLRVRRYGPCTDDAEAARQLREAVAAVEAQGQRSAA